MSGSQVNFEKDQIPLMLEKIIDVVNDGFSRHDYGKNRMSIYDYLTDIIATVSEFAEKVDPASHEEIEKIIDFYQNYQKDEILRKFDLLMSAFDLMLDEETFEDYLYALHQKYPKKRQELTDHKINEQITNLLP